MRPVEVGRVPAQSGVFDKLKQEAREIRKKGREQGNASRNTSKGKQP